MGEGGFKFDGLVRLLLWGGGFIFISIVKVKSENQSFSQ